VTPTIALENVTALRGGRSVLSELSISISPGEVVALLGPSGSGKTTILRLLLGFLAPAKGTVRVGSAVVSKDGEIVVPPEDRNLAVVFQDLALWPHLSVHGNLAFGLEAKGIGRGERERRIKAMLERVGLADKARCYPGELSGGERQRVAIARALVLEPRAVLLDEPLSNLDAALKRELLGVFAELFEEHRSTVLYVTHDLGEAEALAERVIVIEQGAVVQDGTFEELRKQPRSAFVQALLPGSWTEQPR